MQTNMNLVNVYITLVRVININANLRRKPKMSQRKVGKEPYNTLKTDIPKITIAQKMT